jgi:hypothetical protein
MPANDFCSFESNVDSESLTEWIFVWIFSISGFDH